MDGATLAQVNPRGINIFGIPLQRRSQVTVAQNLHVNSLVGMDLSIENTFYGEHILYLLVNSLVGVDPLLSISHALVLPCAARLAWCHR
jgi:hypothetical protein